jgi:hypothetical protein
MAFLLSARKRQFRTSWSGEYTSMYCVLNISREQELSNLLQRRQFTKAICLALTLEQPLRTLNVIKGKTSRRAKQDEPCTCEALASHKHRHIQKLFFCLQILFLKTKVKKSFPKHYKIYEMIKLVMNVFFHPLPSVLKSFAIFYFYHFIHSCMKHLLTIYFLFLDVLLKFLCDWNTNAKHSRVSQLGEF